MRVDTYKAYPSYQDKSSPEWDAAKVKASASLDARGLNRSTVSAEVWWCEVVAQFEKPA